MRLYRIAREPWALDLSGEGARQFGGRWTPLGMAAVYTSEHPALAAWEVFAHIGSGSLDRAPLSHQLVAIEIPDGASVTRVPHVPHVPEQIGRDWLQSGRTLMLSVPSVVIPEARNLILNPTHPEMGAVRALDLGVFLFDPRVGNLP